MSSSVVALARFNLRLTLREPGPAISRIGSPLAFMLVAQPIFRAEGEDHAVLGPLMLFSLLGLSLVANALLTERVWATLDRLRATPLRASGLLLGKLAAPLGILAIQQGAVLGLGIGAFGLPARNLGLLVLFDAVWIALVVSLGAALASVARTPSSVSAAGDLASLACTAFSGALFPVAALPGWAQAVAPVSPAYWGVRGFEGALSGAASPVLHSALVLLAVALAGATIAARRLWR
jgi:ABC-2 type transport system permease protein